MSCLPARLQMTWGWKWFHFSPVPLRHGAHTCQAPAEPGSSLDSCWVNRTCVAQTQPLECAHTGRREQASEGWGCTVDGKPHSSAHQPTAQHSSCPVTLIPQNPGTSLNCFKLPSQDLMALTPWEVPSCLSYWPHISQTPCQSSTSFSQQPSPNRTGLFWMWPNSFRSPRSAPLLKVKPHTKLQGHQDLL